MHSVNIDSISEVDRQVCPPVPENREFAYHELVKITNNFSVCIGEGGFGPVYQGQLKDGTQVAVKMGSQKSIHGQGTKEFFAEVINFTQWRINMNFICTNIFVLVISFTEGFWTVVMRV